MKLYRRYRRGEPIPDLREACQKELRAIVQGFHSNGVNAQLWEACRCWIMLNVFPTAFLFKGLSNYVGPGKKYTHPGMRLARQLHDAQ